MYSLTCQQTLASVERHTPHFASACCKMALLWFSSPYTQGIVPVHKTLKFMFKEWRTCYRKRGMFASWLLLTNSLETWKFSMGEVLIRQNVAVNNWNCSRNKKSTPTRWISYCSNTTFLNSNWHYNSLLLSKLHILSCIIWYKDTNLKAIHKFLRQWKLLYYLIQRYKFESNSQHLCFRTYYLTVVLSDTKIQIWKQFTTPSRVHGQFKTLYYLIQRYKFESNSQLNRLISQNRIVVLSDTKIQIWKQFTTLDVVVTTAGMLYYLIQRYKFESNSQPNVVISSS